MSVENSKEGDSPVGKFQIKKWRNARFAILGNQLTRALEQFYKHELGLSQIEWRVLSSLAELAPASAKDLAEFIATDSFVISRTTSSLVKKGLLIQRIDQQDRRKIELRLSSQGRKAYSKIVPVALQIEQAVFSVLSKQELVQLDAILTKLERNIKQVCDC